MSILSRHITTLVIGRVRRSPTDEVGHDDIDDEEESPKEDSWMRGITMESFICPTISRLIYVVQVHDEILHVFFGEIKTVYTHIETHVIESKKTTDHDDEEDLDGLHEECLASFEESRDASKMSDDVEFLLHRDNLRENSLHDDDDEHSVLDEENSSNTKPECHARRYTQQLHQEPLPAEFLPWPVFSTERLKLERLSCIWHRKCAREES